jgi:hypothetical protein
MPKFWSPVLGIYAMATPPVTEVYTHFLNSEGNENPRPDVDLRISNFSANFGTLTKLVALIHGYYDTDLPGFKRKVTYLAPGGAPGVNAAGSIDPSSATSVWTPWTNEITPESKLTSENSLYAPLCLYSPKSTDAIAAAYGSNGVDGTTIQVRNSINKAILFAPGGGYGSPGEDPAQPLNAKNVALWLDCEDFYGSSPVPDDFFQHYEDGPARKWRGISALTAGHTAGTSHGVIAGWDPVLGYDGTWFQVEAGVKGAGRNFPLDQAVVPVLNNFMPGDAFPFAMLLLGRNADGGPADPSDGYVFTPGDFTGGVSKVLDLIHLSCQFDKVDPVWDGADLTGFV